MFHCNENFVWGLCCLKSLQLGLKKNIEMIGEMNLKNMHQAIPMYLSVMIQI